MFPARAPADAEGVAPNRTPEASRARSISLGSYTPAATSSSAWCASTPFYALPNGRVVRYDPYTIPPRLHDNVACEFARLYVWSEDPDLVAEWIHEAYLNKTRAGVLPDSSRAFFARNRTNDRWSD